MGAARLAAVAGFRQPIKLFEWDSHAILAGSSQLCCIALRIGNPCARAATVGAHVIHLTFELLFCAIETIDAGASSLRDLVHSRAMHNFQLLVSSTEVSASTRPHLWLRVVN